MATKTFQALRIFVNDELNELHNGLEIARHLLAVGGICTVLAFHSLEDRIVKRHFHSIDMDTKFNMKLHDHAVEGNLQWRDDEIVEKITEKQWRPLSRKVQLASGEEVYENPRSRSAKLRAAVKL